MSFLVHSLISPLSPQKSGLRLDGLWLMVESYRLNQGATMSHMTLSSQEQPQFQKKNSFTTPFLLCSYFRAHPTTLLLKILGGRMHGTSPHLKLWGDRPPVPLGLRPCTLARYIRDSFCRIYLHQAIR